MKEAIDKADVLIEALPYIKKFHKSVFVVKYGGSALQQDAVRRAVIEDVAFLRYAGVRPILIHGGGPHVNQRLKDIDHPVKFENGLRVTDAVTLDIVKDEMAALNGTLVKEVNEHGELARGFTHVNPLLHAVKKRIGPDLGFVGEAEGFDTEALLHALENSVPVIAPLGVGEDGAVYNINADDVAYFLASRLQAEKLVLLTKELGVLRDPADESSLISHIRVGEAEQLIADKIVTRGMVPKIRAAVQSLHDGVGKVHIVDAKIPHAILLEIFTDTGIGTEIVH
ncbi:MAG: acetylglutamate kinase [Chitinivibrionales bacterium]|nr:acetylglutamate kinase [Chitinivibrionales bacterium]